MNTISVNANKPIAKINPFIYGVNLEHLELSVYGGYWAELLDNRKFFGPDGGSRIAGTYYAADPGPTPWEAEMQDAPDIGLVPPWKVLNPASGLLCVHDNTTFFSGSQSQRLDIPDTDDVHGIKHENIDISANTTYDCRVVLQASDGVNEVTLALREGEHVIASWSIEKPQLTPVWTEHLSTLAPTHSVNCNFEIQVKGSGQLWIGAVSLMKSEHASAGGMRPDIANKLVEGGITMIRWPGGNFASDYHWQDGVGPIDKRPTRLNRAWGETEPNDLGTDEFLQHCKLLQVEPFITVNAGSGTAEEAASWVEYCNGSADTHWGRLRSQNGHPEPYAVKYWSIGNEIWGNFQVGHVDPETYAYRALEFAEQMKAVDPTIHLTAVGHVRNTGGRWNELVARILSGRIDAMAVHYYNLNPSTLAKEPDEDEKWDAIVAGPLSTASVLDDSISVIDTAWTDDPSAEISFDEWGIRVDLRTTKPWKETYHLRDGLNIAGTLQELQRRGDRVSMAHQFSFVNRLGLIDSNTEAINETACYQAFKLISQTSGSVALETVTETDSYHTSGLASEPPLEDVPFLSAQATTDDSSGSITLSVVNRSKGLSKPATIKLGKPPATPTTTVHELNGNSPLARNKFGDQGQTWVKNTEVNLELTEEGFKYTFPPHSVTVFEIQF